LGAVGEISVKRLVAACLGGAALFLAMDAVWLTLMAERLYRPAIGHLMREGFDVRAAALFYAIYFAGIAVFAVMPSRRMRDAAIRGALFGLVAYATYDLTNQATLRDWPWIVTALDLAWGAIVTSSSAAVAWRIAFARAASADHIPIQPPMTDATRPSKRSGAST
jgi:uncharacterized membrane protein